MALGTCFLYRGSLSSCNYDCEYCPLPKQEETSSESPHDRDSLERFAGWVADSVRTPLSVFFTPWGECLIRPWYRDAVVSLSRLSHVCKVATQTNLSCPLDWLDAADTHKVGLWCTYHPDHTALDAFLAQCEYLEARGVSYSAGCVGLKEHLDDIRLLRKALPRNRYVWINAYKDVPDYYDEKTSAVFTEIDPLFPLNNLRHPSRGRACRCGSTVFAVDGDGDVRRCHFVREVIGNIYRGGFAEIGRPGPCRNETCGCHIGYVHLEHLELDSVFGDGLLERVPKAATEGDLTNATPFEAPT